MRKLNTLLQYFESTVKDVEQGMFFLQPIVQKELSVYSDGFEWKIWNVAITCSFLSNEKKKSVFTVYSIPRRETCVATLYILLRILQEILWDLTRI